jgi:hypothetical protein
MKMTRKMMSLTGLLMATVAIGLVSAAGDEDVFEIQPEIHHVFREAEKMPPAIFSTLFSFISLAPWLLLAVGVSYSTFFNFL